MRSAAARPPISRHSWGSFRSSARRAFEERRLELAALAVHAAVTLAVAMHHEAWGDEADVWLVMRDGGLDALFADIAGRGTPSLWYLLVWPFAASGAPYLAQQLLNLVFVWGSVALIARSPAFPPLVRLIFPFSYYAIFEYPVIARNYGLLMFLTILMAEQWRARGARPLRLAGTIALLAHSAVHGLIIAAVAAGVLLVERSRVRPFRRADAFSFAIMAASGLIAAAQLWPDRSVVGGVASADTVWFAVAGAFFPELRVESALVPAILVLLLVAVSVSRALGALSFLTIAESALLCLFVFVWMAGLRHAGLVLVVAIAAVSIARSYGVLRGERLAMAALAVSLAYSAVPGAVACYRDLVAPYSGSRELAAVLSRERLATVPLVSSGASHSFLVYLPGRKIWEPGPGRYVSFITWEERRVRPVPMAGEEAVGRAERAFGERAWLLVSGRALPPEVADRFRLLHVTGAPWGEHHEQFFLYEPVQPRLGPR